MSDLDDFKSLFDRVGVPYAVSDRDKLTGSYLYNQAPAATQYLQMPPQFSDEHLGYHGFVANFFFDAEGKYLDFGVWE